MVVILLAIGCSPTSWETEQTVPYCSVAGSVWYIQGTANNLDEYIFYNDSVIIWQYNYSPFEQTYKNHVYPQHRVMSIFKRKLEILDKNIPYEDGDGEQLLLQYYRGYTVTESGARPYDWSTYSWIFFTGVWADSMHMGMYDEFVDVQGYWTFHKEPPIQLDFTGWQ
jgi:hypothetical protein